MERNSTNLNHCVAGVDFNDSMAKSECAKDMSEAATWTMVPNADPKQRTATVEVNDGHYTIVITSNRDQGRTFRVEIDGVAVAYRSKDLRKAKRCAMHNIIGQAFQTEGKFQEQEQEQEQGFIEGRKGKSKEEKRKILEQILDYGDSEEIEKLREEVEKLREEVSRKSVEQKVIIETKHKAETTVEVVEGAKHKLLPIFLYYLSQGKNVMAVGPAGSGKTTLAQQCADALGRELRATGAVLQKYELTGYTNAQGDYVKTALYDAIVNGHLFLWDEVDASNPAALVAFNSLMDNGWIEIPGKGRVHAHENFVCIAAANTFGKGADRVYVGRNQLDGATIERFQTVYMDYDEDLELEIALGIWAGAAPWVEKIQRYRAAAEKLNTKHIISPRASYNGAEALRNIEEGIAPAILTEDMVEEHAVWKGLEPEQVAKIKEAA